MDRLFFEHGIDIVDCGDIRLFMPMNDNLYNICVPEDRKKFSIFDHYNSQLSAGYQRSPVTRETLGAENSARFVLYHVLAHFLDNVPGLSFIDVGAWVGDVSIRYANFCRTIGAQCNFYSFDPTIAGDLIPYNLQLNGLSRSVEHFSLAISPFTGPIPFSFRAGHTDSSRSALGQDNFNAIVHSIKLSEFISDKNIESAIIKLDTENLEPAILREAWRYVRNSHNAIMVETQRDNQDTISVLQELSQTHVLYDIGYVPRPFRADRIENCSEYFDNIQVSMPYGYTDVLAISNQLPKLQNLMERLKYLIAEPVIYSLAY